MMDVARGDADMDYDIGMMGNMVSLVSECSVALSVGGANSSSLTVNDENDLLLWRPFQAPVRAVEDLQPWRCVLALEILHCISVSPAGLVGAIIVVMVVAMLYEGLKSLREVLVLYDVKRRAFVLRGPQHDLQADPEEREPLMAE